MKPFSPSFRTIFFLTFALAFSLPGWRSDCAAAEARLIRMPSSPALSPDGKIVAFAWKGDIWSVPTAGGGARQLTRHTAADGSPAFSPDGKQIAFTSSRKDGRQVFVMPVSGGEPRQLTHHTEGYAVEEWHPDGEQILTSLTRDHFWKHGERFSFVSAGKRGPDKILFDAYGSDGRLSPDGGKLLFTRESERWWRKGYRGSRSSQIWLFNSEDGGIEKLVDDEQGSRWPLWKPSGKGFYYVGQRDGAFNLRERNLESGKERQITKFEDDSVVYPAISRDGSTLVFRHLFDLYAIRLGKDEKPQKIKIQFPGDSDWIAEERRILDKATNVAFSKDGLEIAFIAGGDLWVMDTELKEPIQITDSAEEESEPLFAPDGKSIVFISDQGGQSDLWKVERADAEKYWWQNKDFKMTRLTNDPVTEHDTAWSPDGEHISFLRERGDFWIMKPDGKDARRLFESWNDPQYDWSPDGKWLVYAVSDNDFNRDIWISPIDASREPFNLSRHPDNDYSPRWSPDGRKIAFTGRRRDTETDIYYVWLREEDDQKNTRERTLEKALEKMKKARAKKPTPAKPTLEKPKTETRTEKPPDSKAPATPDKKVEPSQPKKKPGLTIDFEGLQERLHRVSVADTSESGLFWSHDSKKLAFAATIDGKRGTYTISIPGSSKPTLLSTKTGGLAHWIASGNQILWLSEGKPGTLNSKGQTASYAFKARQRVDLPAKFRAAFDQSWRTMRDHFYDEKLGNRNWDKVRQKYIGMAGEAPNGQTLGNVINMMLGELNGSHLGFYYRGPSTAAATGAPQWSETTSHLGVRFDPDYNGPGLRVRDVLPDSPATDKSSRILPGEVVLAIDGIEVDSATDITTVLNGVLERDIALRIQAKGKRGGKRKQKKAATGETREITLRPISYSRARSLLYEKWIDDNQAAVAKASKGRLGYLHIAGMNMTSFYRFEEELYSVAAGKDGILIDVRENGGGSTTDHLLTILTQPRHSITVPRGGGQGYPHDRKIYASWNKPVAVLCNQNSFSNAEIFSHAIKHLKRGKVIGVPTAGGVISTGGRSIMDLGYLRMPFRGWYLLNNGQDMELNGAVPHHVVWNAPGDLPGGADPQLKRAIKALKKDVRKFKNRPQPKLIKSSERKNP